MKFSITFILILIVSLAQSQDARLSQNNWSLVEFYYQGADVAIPNNSEVTSVPIIFETAEFYDFRFYTCGGDLCEVTADISNTQIDVSMIGCLAGGCGNLTNVLFASKYDGFFHTYLSNPVFDYTITSHPSGIGLQLTISNIAGDFVIYNSQEVNSVPEKMEINLTLYPNPASEVIHLDYDTNFELDFYSIYDLSGKRIQSGAVVEKKIILKALSAGRYFLTVEDTSRGLIFNSSFVAM